MEVTFKKECGQVLPTKYTGVDSISQEELKLTIELLEYENDCRVKAYVKR